jgi:hypothetical protein
MDRLLRKFSSKYKRAKEEVNKWCDLQSQFVSLLGNATTILERFPVMIIASTLYILSFSSVLKLVQP